MVTCNAADTCANHSHGIRSLNATTMSLALNSLATRRAAVDYGWRGVAIALLVSAGSVAVSAHHRHRSAALVLVEPIQTVTAQFASPIKSQVTTSVTTHVASQLASQVAPQVATTAITPVASFLESAVPHAAPPAPVPAGRIAIVGDRVEIDIRAMPLGDAARLLAVATQTPLDSIEALRDAKRRVTLQWQGRSAVAAWQQLLSDDVNFVSRCVGRTCSVRVLGLIAASSGEPSASAGVAAAPGSAFPGTTNAPAPTLSPDPPGLFPSDG